MAYLKNEICEFDTLTAYDKNKKYNILSACFFKMENHYKNFSIYTTKIKKLIALLETQSKYVLRIFIDVHIKNDTVIYNMLKNSNKIHIILFKCTDYVKNNYHFDVFGSLVRLFPLFDFENNDALNVITVDIDLNDEDLIRLEKLMNYESISKEIIGMATSNNLLIMKEEPHYFCGCFGLFNKKFNKNIIIDFIRDAHNITDTGIYGKRVKPFGYGVDEIFLNKYLIHNKSLDNASDTKMAILFKYNVYFFLYHYKKELLIEKPNESFKYLKYILGKYYLPNMTTEDMFNQLDKLTYEIPSNDYKKIYVSKRFYEVMDDLEKTNTEWFSPENVELIKNYFYGIVDCISALYYTKKNLKIYDVKIMGKNIVKNNHKRH